MVNYTLIMSTECPFLNGNGERFQCHQPRALPEVRRAIGYDGLPLIEVKKDLCQSPNGNREELCPVFKNLQEIGRKSQFARPV